MKESLPGHEGWDHEQLARYVLRHVVALYFDLRKDGRTQHLVYTAYVLSISGRWILMTAGHCITEIQKYRRGGFELARCRLVDHLGTGAQFDRPTPFDYDAAQPAALFDDPTFDYGVLIPSRNTCQLMQANNVVPLDEKWWNSEPESIAGYFLFGIPAELTEIEGKRVHIHPTMARLDHLEDRPDGFSETDAPMFYGRLHTNPLRSLRGFSGGPIFSFGSSPDGQAGYWLHAMQVSSLRGGREISAMLMAPLCQFLRGFPRSAPGCD